MMGARDEVWQLYQKETDPEVKERIIQALFMGGDAARLIEVANGDSNTDSAAARFNTSACSTGREPPMRS